MKWECNLIVYCTVISFSQHYLLKRQPSSGSVKLAQDNKPRFIFLTGLVVLKNDLLGAVLRPNSMVWARVVKMLGSRKPGSKEA